MSEPSQTSTPRVQILDPILANQIAAGEVVERPASAAKELIENAIDAGATSITVELIEGGSKLLRVVDDGHGMSQADALLALERHATSKISVVDDLNRIHTLGFRGEALPSISSVSKLTLRTRTRAALMATELKLEGGAQLKISEVGARVGTEVRVEDLFFNVPARRKFLKSASTEGQLIQETLQRVALCYPHVACKLIKEGSVTFDYPAHESLLARVEAMFGVHTASHLHRVSAYGQLELEGLLSLPSHSYSAHRHGYTFINDRYVKDRLFLGAIQRAYGQRLPRGRYPFYLIKLKVHPSLIDVNVHPAKTEVRFVNEEVVLDLLSKALRGAVKLMPQEEQASDDPWAIVPGGLTLANDEPNDEPTDEPTAHQEQAAPHIDLLARHRAQLQARLQAEGDEEAPEESSSEARSLQAQGQRPAQRGSHLEGRSSEREATLKTKREPSGRHQVSYVSQGELKRGLEELTPQRELTSTHTTRPQQDTSAPPLSSPPLSSSLTPDTSPSTLSEVSAPLRALGRPHTHEAPLPPLSALTQANALASLRSLGRASAWWVQEARDGLLLTHLPSLYAHMMTHEPSAAQVNGLITFALSPQQAQRLNARPLSDLGVSFEPFGELSVRLVSLPQGLEEDCEEGDLRAPLEALLTCASGEESATWLKALTSLPLSATARARALTWLREGGRALIERGEAPSCFVQLSWRDLLRQRGGLPLF